jgi:hypothetical protein
MTFDYGLAEVGTMPKVANFAARPVLLLITFLAGVLMVIALSTLNAEARHRHYGYHGWPDVARLGARSRDTALLSAGEAAPLGRLTGEFIRDCDREVTELKNLPLDSIGEAIRPDETQNNALVEISAAAADAADRLAPACQRQAPAEPIPRLDAVSANIDAVVASLDKLDPLVRSFYQSLQDEQKARLATRYTPADAPAISETTGAAPNLKRHRLRRSRYDRVEDSTNDTVEDKPPAAAPWDCGQWEAELRAWPTTEVEQAPQLAARQRGAFYELAAALQYAADGLADSCPQQTSLTPISRLQDMQAKLDALHRSIATIRGPLARFYDVLDGGQRNRFAAIM